MQYKYIISGCEKAYPSKNIIRYLRTCMYVHLSYEKSVSNTNGKYEQEKNNWVNWDFYFYIKKYIFPLSDTTFSATIMGTPYQTLPIIIMKRKFISSKAIFL